MTVANQTYKVQAQGNGAATTFSFSPMVVLQSADLQVTITSTAGVDTQLVEGTGTTNYSVSVASYPGTGSVVYPASGATRLQVGEFITIKRLLIIEQLTDLENQGGYFPDTQETALDRTAMVDLQQQEEIDRVLKVPVSDLTANLTIPTAATRAGKVLGFDAAGLPIASNGLSDVVISAFVATIVDDVDAAAVRTTIGLGALAVKNTVATADIDNDAVTLDKLENGTQGDILYYGAAGAPARLGTGTVGQVLQAGGAGANPSWTTLTGLPRGQQAGCVLSNNVTDATNDIDISTGAWKSSDNTTDLTLTAATGKRLDASWATGGTPGTPTGGLSSSLAIANTTYFVHLILVSGVVEVGFDTSAIAANLIADHGATKYRRIGCILRESAAIVLFQQTGDVFRRANIYQEDVHAGTTAQTVTLPTPVGLRLIAQLRSTGGFSGITNGAIFTDLAMADVAPSTTATPGVTIGGPNSSWSGVTIQTNTSAQIRTRTNEAATIKIVTEGWYDTRGRFE